MERTLYFNYTKPSQTQLNYTEDTKVRAILKRQRSSAQMGIRTGFRVTVNALDLTTIDIGPGEGYTGGYFENKNVRSTNAGECISTLTSVITGSGYTPTVEGQALVDYTDGTKNYISLLYTETLSSRLAENRYPAYAEHDTIVTEAYTVEALSEADWLLLSDDELENRVLVAVVTAKGAGVALDIADIDQLIQPNNHPYAVPLTTLSAITISSVSDETTIGTGVVRWDPAANMLYWAAPGDSEGVGTSVTSNGTYFVYSATTPYFIEVIVTFASLPAVETSENLVIRALYGRQIPLYCAVDQAHRDMVGSGTQSPTNPHGLSIDDISGGTFEHADLFHKNGITCHSDRTQLECAIDLANDRVSIKNLGLKDNSFLIDGTTYQLINGVAALIDGYVNFNSLDTGDYMIYLNSSAALSYARLSDAQFDDGATFGGFIKLVDIHSETIGACSLTWDLSSRTLTYTGPDGGAGTPIPLQQTANGLYYKLYSSDALNWIIVYVDGDLVGGAVADTTLNFNTELAETVELDQSMMRLCVVSWDDVGELLTNLFDLRRFNTADNRTAVEEEHDEFGGHSKVLHNPFRVAGLNNTAIFASAGSYGVHAEGGNPTEAVSGTGIRATGYASVAGNAVGVYGCAVNTLVANVSRAIGVHGLATALDATGVRGQGTSGTGVYGDAARNRAGYFAVVNAAVAYATDVTALYASANANDVAAGSEVMGIVGDATNVAQVSSATGVVGRAPGTSATGVLGSALAGTGIYGKGDQYGVYGSASNYGVYGTAATDYAFRGFAVRSYGVWGEAGTNIGVYGTVSNVQDPAGASITGVYGRVSAKDPGVGNYAIGGKFEAVNTDTAASVIGVYGGAAHTAVYGIAATNTGVMGSAVDTGVYGKATTNGVYGLAAGNTGVIGSAQNYGVYGAAGTDAGVYGIAVKTYGVYGRAEVLTGVYGTAPNVGVAGEVATNTAVYGTAAGLYGGYFIAPNSALVASAATNKAIYANAGAANLNAEVYAVQVTANNSGDFNVVGVYVDAANAKAAAAASAVAIRGGVGGAGATAIYGYAASGTGCYALAPAANCIGVYGSAPGVGGSAGYFNGYQEGILAYGGSDGVYARGTGANARGVNASGSLFGVDGLGGSAGIYGVGGSFGGVFDGDNADVLLMHGNGVAALSFIETMGGALSFISYACYVRVIANGTVFRLPLIATA